VFELLRRRDVGFVLVSSAERLSVDEAIYFHDRLEASKMPLGAFVVNRVHEVAPSQIDRETLIDKLSARPELRGYAPDDMVQIASDLARTHKDFEALAEIDGKQVTRLSSRAGGHVPVVKIPFFDEDIYDVAGLSKMVHYLVET
jgi:anion-transporting  ArsA/GET3 family ATPase